MSFYFAAQVHKLTFFLKFGRPFKMTNSGNRPGGGLGREDEGEEVRVLSAAVYYRRQGSHEFSDVTRLRSPSSEVVVVLGARTNLT